MAEIIKKAVEITPATMQKGTNEDINNNVPTHFQNSDVAVLKEQKSNNNDAVTNHQSAPIVDAKPKPQHSKPTNEDVDNLLNKFSKKMQPILENMKQWLQIKELKNENEKLKEIIIHQEIMILNQRKIIELYE